MAVAGTLAAALLVTACVGGPSPQPDSTPGTLPSRSATTLPSVPSQPYATDASLILGLTGDPTNWNPLAAPAGADPALTAVSDAVLPSAFVAGADGAETRNGELLTSATATGQAAAAGQTAGGQAMTVVYDINPRAVWSDGTPVTAADFVYTWEAQSGQSRFRDRGGRPFTPASTAGYRSVTSVAAGAGDPDRVVVRFSAPDPGWESLFDPILPAAEARSVGFDHGFSDPVTSLLSAGPFLVQSYRPGSDVTLVRNPAWWGPTANLAAIDVTFVTGAGEATEGLEEGQLGAAVSPFTPSGVAALRSTSGLTVSVGAGLAYDDLVLREGSGALSERAVRLALMTAVDRSALARSAAAAGDTGATPVEDRVAAPGTVGYHDDAGILGTAGTRAATRARQLLAMAGFTVSAGQLTRLGTAVRLSLAVGSTSPLADDEAAAVVSAGRSLGITVTAVGSSADPASPAAQAAADMDLVEVPLASAASLAATYGSGSAANPSGYASTVMDGLLARLATAGTASEAAALERQVDVLAWDDAVDLPLLAVPQVVAYQSRYDGITATATALGIGDDPAGWGIPASA